ncbi:MAG: hypothetical protein QOJ01_666 [Solirubrobacterales bacterium]|nr:hypothetical protein [Solirubrobacterales bacterium]
MLSEDEARRMTAWVVSANTWSVASQAIVESATGLATQSRELADRLRGNDAGDGGGSLPGDLRVLADAVEADSVEMRDR